MAGRVVFQADTSQFTAPVERSATTVRELSRALKEQQQTVRETYRDQVANAKAAGASTEELSRIEQERYRSLLALQAAERQLNAENVSSGKAAVDSAAAQKDAVDLVTRAYQQQLVAVEATFGAIKQQQVEVAGSIAGGAAIRTLDGGQNVRAVENFLAKTLGLGPVLQALFPIVGGIAFIQLLTEAGSKVYELSQRADEAQKVLRTSLDDSHAKLQVTIDDLNLQADKIQLNIDKLSGHPGDGLKLGIDQAKKSADELLTSLSADRKELESLFKESHVGSIAAALSQTNPTGQQEASIKVRQDSYQQSIRAIEDDINGRLANASTQGDLTSLEAERRRRIEQAGRNQLTSIAGERKDLVSGNTSIDVDARTGQISTHSVNDVRIGQLDAYRQQVQSGLSLYQARNRVADLMDKEQNLRGSGEGTKDVAEASRKASEAQLQQWETDLKEQKQYGDMSSEQEREFWRVRVFEVNSGVDSFRFAYDKYLDAMKKVSDEQKKQIDEIRKLSDQWQAEQLRSLVNQLSPGALAQSRGIVDAQTTGVSLANARRDAGYAGAEGGINAEQQAGQITKLDAAIQLQTLHTRQYNEQLQQLKDNLAAVRDTDPDAQAQRNRINQQIVGLDASRGQQVIRDNTAVSPGDSSAAVGFSDAINDFVRAANDAAGQMRNITTSILSGLNQNLSSALVGGRTNFSGYFRGVGQQLGEVGLQHIEAPVLSALGLGGKADGSASNPFSVRVVGSSLGGAAGSIAGSITGGDDDDDGGGLVGKIGSKVGGFFSSIFGGGRASGGDVTAGKIYKFNESGQELFAPSVNGNVIPNSALRSLGGDTHNWNVDARGANDPAAVEQAVQRGIAAAAPMLVGQSVSATQERQLRRPITAR